MTSEDIKHQLIIMTTRPWSHINWPSFVSKGPCPTLCQLILLSHALAFPIDQVVMVSCTLPFLLTKMYSLIHPADVPTHREVFSHAHWLSYWPRGILSYTLLPYTQTFLLTERYSLMHTDFPTDREVFSHAHWLSYWPRGILSCILLPFLLTKKYSLMHTDFPTDREVFSHAHCCLSYWPRSILLCTLTFLLIERYSLMHTSAFPTDRDVFSHTHFFHAHRLSYWPRCSAPL